MVSPGDLDDYGLTAAEPGAREGAAQAPEKPRDQSMQYHHGICATHVECVGALA
jgi:hypothetical protein